MHRARRLELSILPLAGLLCLAGCSAPEEAAGPDAGAMDPGGGGGGGGSDAGPAPADGGGQDDPAPAEFRECTGLSYTSADDPTGFDHFSNELTSYSGSPTHHAEDVVVTPGQTATVGAAFTYSDLSLDIEDEAVRVSLDACDGWQDLGEVRTDDDGRVEVELGGPLPAGVYHVVFEVAADDSVASAYVWSLPAGTHLAVFDIDGTLTSSDTEVFKDVLLGDYVPNAYPDAQTLTTAREAQGYIPVYLTGRPGFLTETTRSWLADQGFAGGVVHLTESASQVVPTDGGVGAYKRDFLTDLTDAGMVVDVGYGNAATDIFAYLSAGLAADHVWIIGSHGGEEGTNAVTDAWTDVAAEVAAEPAIDQPFKR